MRREQREAEFTEFYLARRRALRRTAYLVVRDWHTAEDLTQVPYLTTDLVRALLTTPRPQPIV